MTTEEEQLIFKDICARIPYGVIVHSLGLPHEQKLVGYIPDIEKYNIKPYLRPMSSMTEKEENEYRAINCYEGLFPCNEEALDYVLEHHFDFRDLIKKGLALEAPEGMYA